MALIFVDCEAYGGCPATGKLIEFCAIELKSCKTFYRKLVPSKQDTANAAIQIPLDSIALENEISIFQEFDIWLSQFDGRPIFVSDNVAYDWQWINDGFHRTLGYNPFGHSGRRIGDFYAGLVGDFYAKQKWKDLRVTKHDHNPVNDCNGNIDAFTYILSVIDAQRSAKIYIPLDL